MSILYVKAYICSPQPPVPLLPPPLPLALPLPLPLGNQESVRLRQMEGQVGDAGHLGGGPWVPGLAPEFSEWEQ